MSLTKATLGGFQRALARRLPCPVRIVLTGGSEALLLGGVRPTADVDFEVVLAPARRDRWPDIERAIGEASRETDIPVQYSSDIDRWSSVAIPPSQRRSIPHRRVGRLSIHLLEPTCWAVYKLARYLDTDVEDLRIVLRRQRVPWQRLARLTGACLRTSPRSTQLFLFRRQVEDFFRSHGPTVWGRKFDAADAIRAFHGAAGIAGAGESE